MPKSMNLLSIRRRCSSEGLQESKFRQWPAVSICFGVTTCSFFLVFMAAAAGWPGPITSNCYEDYLITADCYCERLRGDQPSDVWFAQPMNTISNMWFVIAGLVIAYDADSRSLRFEQQWETMSNPMAQNKEYSVTYALASCLLGVGSTCLHASFTTWGRQLDMTAMYLIATFSFIYPFVKRRQITKEQTNWVYFLANAGLIYWTFFVGTPGQTRRLFTTMIVTSWTMEVLWVDQETAKRNARARRILMATIGMFLVGVLVWKASESAGPLCYPDSLWQGHSLWHLQSALAIAGQYFYYIAEDYPMVKIIIEDPPHAESISDSSSESGSVSS